MYLKTNAHRQMFLFLYTPLLLSYVYYEPA